MLRQTTIYLAGPMRGYVQYNFPLFDEWEEYILSCNIAVVSPARMDRECDDLHPENFPEGWDWNTVPVSFSVTDAMRRDIREITKCTHIIMLPGWQYSSGACAEFDVARACGLHIGLADREDPYPVFPLLIPETPNE